MSYKIRFCFLFGWSFLFLFSGVNAQQLSRCGTDEYFKLQQQKDPSVIQRVNDAQNAAQQWLKQNPVTARNVYVIPIVVHVVYKTSIENISDEQIMSQIDVLNEDYNRANTDTAKVPLVWKSVASNVPIQFCLAAYDPDGNITTGIERVQTTQTIFGLDDSVKHASLGGADGWPSKDYLNIWVCNLGGGVLGYTTLPGSASGGDDGVVVLYHAFGRTGTLLSHYNLGRTCTHEVGHWFGLYHPWGDDDGACSGNDHINDTPNEAGPTFGCPSFPLFDNCSPDGDGVMFMDYMDYTDDACMYMFTADQIAEMISQINTSRASVLTSPAGCQGIHYNLDASISAIVFPNDTLREQAFQPQVQLSNRGADNLTYVKINYAVDGQPSQSYDYTDSLPSSNSALITLPYYFTGEGGHVFYTWSSDPNDSVDEFPYNDTATANFTVKSTIAKNTASVYPSPVADLLSVKVENPSDAEMEMQIVNEVGQIVMKQNVSLLSQQVLTVNVSGLPVGIYFLYGKIGYYFIKEKFFVMRD